VRARGPQGHVIPMWLTDCYDLRAKNSQHFAGVRRFVFAPRSVVFGLSDTALMDIHKNCIYVIFTFSLLMAFVVRRAFFVLKRTV